MPFYSEAFLRSPLLLNLPLKLKNCDMGLTRSRDIQLQKSALPKLLEVQPFPLQLTTCKDN
jgi:hypothetical protein